MEKINDRETCALVLITFEMNKTHGNVLNGIT